MNGNVYSSCPRRSTVFPILKADFLASGIKRFTIEAPRIARKQQAGQFIILRLHDHGERIPLTIASSDPAAGTIDIIGPLGKPSEVHNFGTVVVIGGGVGTAIAYPSAAAMKKAGNKVISIIG